MTEIRVLPEPHRYSVCADVIYWSIKNGDPYRRNPIYERKAKAGSKFI